MLNRGKHNVTAKFKRPKLAVFVLAGAILLLTLVGTMVWLRSSARNKNIFAPEVKSYKSPDESNQSLVAEKDRIINEASTPEAKRDAYIQKALVLIEQNDEAGAIKAYKLAEQSETSNPEASIALCNIYFLAKKQTEAKTYCQKAADLIGRDVNSPFAANRTMYEQMASAAQAGTFSDAAELKDVKP